MNLKKKTILLWVFFALLDPDPDPLTRLIPDPIRIRIRNPATLSVVTRVPDPGHLDTDLCICTLDNGYGPGSSSSVSNFQEKK
jgi:hypothetical protein